MFCTCEYRECICIPHRIMHCPCGRLLNNTAECNSNVAWGVGGTSTLCMISEEYDGLIRKKTQPLSQLRNNGNSSFAGPYSYILSLQKDSLQQVSMYDIEWNIMKLLSMSLKRTEILKNE